MKSAWITSTIGSQVLLQRGFDITKAQQRDGSVPVVSSGGISSYHDVAMVKGPGVVLGRKGTLGSVFYLAEDYWPHDTTLWVKDFKGNLPRFVYYFFKSMSAELLALDNATANPALNRNHVHPIEVFWPSRPMQQSIVDILGALDDKIASNSEANCKLEQLASTLFASWFVDFDPVVAKRDGTTAITAPLEAVELFPSHFEESEIGPIPERWRIVPLDSVADFLNGLALQRYPPRDADELPVIKIAELRAGTSVGADRCGGVPSEYVIDDGDVVFSWSGSLMVDVWCGGRGALNQHLFKVTSSDVPKWFYLAWLNEHLPEFQAIAADKATTMGHIRRFHLTEAKVLLPPEPLMKAMTSVQQPLLEQIIHNRVESRTLAELRDTLLGPLLSGELTIKSADSAVGAAL